MPTPSISSHTVGLTLSTFTGSRQQADEATASRVRSSAVARATRTAQVSAKRKGIAWKSALPGALVLLNVLFFGFYLYNVNRAEGLAFTTQQSQKELRKLQDERRQLQVRTAEALAGIRTHEVVGSADAFVPVGTPEFVSGASSTVLTMR